MGENLDQINNLLGDIDRLKKEWNLSGSLVVANWMNRRIQPLQQQAHFEYQYIGEKDPSRFTANKITQVDVTRQVNRVLVGVTVVPNIGGDFRSTKRPLEII